MNVITHYMELVKGEGRETGVGLIRNTNKLLKENFTMILKYELVLALNIVEMLYQNKQYVLTLI